MYKTLVVVFMCFLLAGCDGLSGVEGKQSYASYIGDQYSVALNEVVVSVPVADEVAGYQNLHVFLSAIINTDKSLWGKYEVESIVRRSGARLSSFIVEEVYRFGDVSAKDLRLIHKQLIAKTQRKFDSIFSEWSHSEEYKVEIVIVSLFLTDASVGKGLRGRFW